MVMLSWTNGTRKLGDLVGWPKNPRQIKKIEARRLRQSLKEFGQVLPICIDPDNQIIDGHQRKNVWELADEYGPELVVDVRVSSRPLIDREQQKLTIFLHRGAMGEFDFDSLANFFGVDDLLDWGFDAKDLDMSLWLDEHPDDHGPELDRGEELQEKWGTKKGDLWGMNPLIKCPKCGKRYDCTETMVQFMHCDCDCDFEPVIEYQHLLICGDCTDVEVVARLMGREKVEMVWTDPPYGESIGDKNKYLNSIAPSNRIEENLQNDTLDENGITKMLCAAFNNAILHCTAGAGWYVAAPPGPPHILFGQVLKDLGIWRQTIQWVKNNSTFSPMGVCYHWQAEPILFGWLPNGGHRWYGGRKQTTVWNIDRPLKSKEHPTMKPVELVTRAIENSSLHGEIVYDPFGGSGTTMVACNNLGRQCRMVEIDSKYCSVILERMSQIGLTPVLVRETACKNGVTGVN